MSEQSETKFDVEAYRWLGECRGTGCEASLPQDDIDGCKAGLFRNLIDEIDRLNAELSETKATYGDGESLSEVRAFGPVDENGTPVGTYGMIVYTQRI